MPEYDYRCRRCDVLVSKRHSMLESPEMACPACGQPMERVFSVPAVNWGGLKPSQGEIHPNIRRMVDDAPMRRDQEKR